MRYYYLPFILGLVLSYIMTPVAKKIAYKVGAIDIPKDERRVHSKPIPRLGGLAIYFSTIISYFILKFTNIIIMDDSIMYILIGGTIIVLVGVIDDIKPLPAKVKLLFQIIAALVLVMGNVKITKFTNPFGPGHSVIKLGSLATPITVFWIVGITNTMNLIDGLDGLAAGVGGIASLSLLFVAGKMSPGMLLFYMPVIAISAILAGACFGFLPHNFNPAKIFMGDTGALFIGFMLASLSVRGVMKGFAAVSLVLPIMILGIPIFDTAFAIFRRFINKKPIMEADRGHLHHRLLDKGFSQKQAVLILYLISLTLGVVALLVTGMDTQRGIATIGLVTVFILLFASHIDVLDIRKSRSKK